MGGLSQDRELVPVKAKQQVSRIRYLERFARLGIVLQVLTQGCASSYSGGSYLEDLASSPRATQEKEVVALIQALGYKFSPHKSDVLVALDESGPCSLGETSGNSFSGNASGAGIKGDAWSTVGTVHRGSFVLVQLGDYDVSAFPPEWTENLTDDRQALIDALVTENLELPSCGRTNPIFLDQLSVGSQVKAVSDVPLLGEPSPEVLRSIAQLRSTIKRVMGVDSTGGEPRQVIRGGRGVSLIGTIVVRESASDKKSGFSLGVDPVHGNLLHLIVWRGCDRVIPLYP